MMENILIKCSALRHLPCRVLNGEKRQHTKTCGWSSMESTQLSAGFRAFPGWWNTFHCFFGKEIISKCSEHTASQAHVSIIAELSQIRICKLYWYTLFARIWSHSVTATLVPWENVSKIFASSDPATIGCKEIRIPAIKYHNLVFCDRLIQICQKLVIQSL